MFDKTIPTNIFRAYDIRGTADTLQDISETIGKAIGTYFIRQGGKKLVVGRDNRKSSNAIKENFVHGLLSTGCDVIDIGLSSSPLLYFTVIEWKTDGGINITGSHLPPSNNGFKIVGREAFPIATVEIEKIREIALSNDFISGSGTYSQGSSVDTYFERLRKPIKMAQMERRLRVVIDCGNAITGKFAPTVIRNLGCEVVELYCDLDDNFPNHLPDPEKIENVRALQQRVLHFDEKAHIEKADIGLAFDGDGDRLGIIDETGTYRETDFTLILLARDYLTRHEGAKILFDVKSSQNVIDEIRLAGGQPVLWKTGHSLIKQKMREDNILLGAEFSGHIFAFEDYYPIDDALYAASKVLSILAASLASSNEPLSSHWAGLVKRYSTHLLELPCADEKKFEVIQKVVEETSARYEVITVDGARIQFEHGWAVIRASNTSANLTVRFEADAPESLVSTIEYVRQLLSKHPSVDIKPLEKLLEEERR